MQNQALEINNTQSKSIPLAPMEVLTMNNPSKIVREKNGFHSA
jgi:hypothetical protein